MHLTDRHRAYWRTTLRLTLALLAVWFLVTFVSAYFAVALNEYSFLGIPFAFYIFAQGALIVFIAIIAIYVRTMNRLDREYGVAERR